MKIKTLLENINNIFLLILNCIKISIVAIIIFFIYNFYSDIMHFFKKETKKNNIPSYKLEDIIIKVDNNFEKNTKSLLQKINERFFTNNKEQIKIINGSQVTIIIDGSLSMQQSNLLLKNALCKIYIDKIQNENDLNKKRIFEILSHLYCY